MAATPEIGSPKVDRPPMVADLAAKLDRIASTHPDAKVRAAARRDADGYQSALAAKVSS